MWKTLAALSCLLALGGSACVPDFSEKVLSDTAILEHPAVVAAFDEVQRSLSALYVNTTRDGFSFAVVHASSPQPVYTFNNGSLKFNETDLYPAEENVVTSDSIFRVMSVSKNIAMLSALVLENHPDTSMTLDSPLRTLLPEFRLSPADWKSGGSEITLRMLAAHTAGIPREGYSTDFNVVLATGKANTESIGSAWAGASTEEVIERIANNKLMFAPGSRAAYSNAGIALLGSGVASHYNNVTGSSLSWSELVTQDVLGPLEMAHSFFGPVPQDLIPDISVPGGDNWADLLVGSGYEAAAGMWSSANDLSSYLHKIWLSPEPILITPFQRRQVLKPVYALPDGKQQVGPGWEIQLLSLSTGNKSTSTSNKLHSIFGKSGNGGGWQSWIDVIPTLGYGIVALSQQSGQEDYASVVPTQTRDVVHGILAPAFASALASRTTERFAGRYTIGHDTGLTVDEVETSASNQTTYARLEVEDQVLYLREVIVNGTSALEAVDKLGWTADAQPRYFSTSVGVVMEPADGQGENHEFGPGTQVWRMNFPGLETCDWFDFDGYHANMEGWPLSKVVLVEKDGIVGNVDLHYPPFDIVLSKRSN